MKLLRYGPKGQEKPGLLDQNGKIRDLSKVVDDIAGEALQFGFQLVDGFVHAGGIACLRIVAQVAFQLTDSLAIVPALAINLSQVQMGGGRFVRTPQFVRFLE